MTNLERRVEDAKKEIARIEKDIGEAQAAGWGHESDLRRQREHLAELTQFVRDNDGRK